MYKSISKKFQKISSYILIFLFHLPFVFAKIKPLKHSSQQGNQTLKSAPSFAFDNKLVFKKNDIYDSLRLNALGLSREAYDCAIKGYNYLRSLGKLNNDKVISIVDFSLQSSRKRLFVLDLINYKILFNTLVAHGKNSGKDYANTFSNRNESNKSSLGFYVTQDTYNGNHGYSLRLQGEERGINDNANNRAIVMHSAWYVNETIARSQGYIGRSEGCPAVPEGLHKSIIEKIKNGSCLFLFSPDKYYISHSQILHQANAA